MKSRLGITKEFLEKEVALGKSFIDISKENKWDYSTVKKYAKFFNIKTGYKNYNDLTDKIFGNLKVIKLDRCENRRAYWKCECKCGNIKICKSQDLVKGAIKTCGCSGKNWQGYQEISRCFYTKILEGAKRRNINVDISIKDIWNIYINQNKKCALSGIELSFVRDVKKNRRMQTASLDRINSAIGYKIDNIQILHKHVNLMKHVLSNFEVFLLCKDILYPLEEPNEIIILDRHKFHQWKGCGNFPGAYYANIKRDAIYRNIDFNLSIEFLWDLYVKQKGCCAISGRKINFKTINRMKQNISLDRINSSIGYIEGNVQWTYKYVNYMKLNKDMETLLYWCKLIYEYNKDKYESS